MALYRKISVWWKGIGLVILAFLAFYGAIRLYYRLTDGFSIENISSDFSFQPQWQIRPLTAVELRETKTALNQPYRYLGKGCQSYVFLSDDGKYVIKFFKYQRFRLQPWVEYFPGIDQYRKEKIEQKWNKLNVFVTSWKIAFDYLKDESGLIYVHLNKTKELNIELTIYDKMGFRHLLNLDEMEFCIQKRATPLEDVLKEFKMAKQNDRAEKILSKLLGMIVYEYQRGIGDNDHALLQNTGVIDGQPIHIDIGQFILNNKYKQPDFYHQELFTKTYRLRRWVKENYPQIEIFLDAQLEQIIGPAFNTMQPKFHAHWEIAEELKN